MSKAFKWPKLPNSRPYLDKGYTSIQMREYAMKCIGEAIRNKQWIGLTDEEIQSEWKLVERSDFYDCVVPLSKAIEAKLKEKNCGQ